MTKANHWASWFEENVSPGGCVLIPVISNMTRRQVSYALKQRGLKGSVSITPEGLIVCRKS